MFNITKNSVKLYLIAVLCISFNQVKAVRFYGLLGKCCPETTRGQKHIKYIALEKERTRQIEKEGTEAEIAFITKSFMGFVNPDVQPGRSLIEDYSALREGSTIEQYIVPVENFNEIDVGERIEMCKDMLYEPVLRANNIYYDADASRIYDIDYGEKLLRFEYYTREPETVLALKCPVTFNGFPNFLYFGGTGWHENKYLEPDSYFFVMFASSSEADSLTMLMRTKIFPERHSQESTSKQDIKKPLDPNVPFDFDQLTVPADLEDEPSDFDQLTELADQEDEPSDFDQLTVPADPEDVPSDFDQLTVPVDSEGERSRLLKMDAERAYITANYVFINLDRTKAEEIDQIIKYIDLFKSGHEVERSSMDVSLFDKKHFETRLNICWEFIENSKYLRTKYILDNQGCSKNLGTVLKTITYAGLELPPELPKRQLIECPVSTADPYPVKGSIYFDKIDYIAKADHIERADLFVLFDSLLTEDSVYVQALTKTKAVDPLSPIESKTANDDGRPKRRHRRINGDGTSEKIQEVGTSNGKSASRGTESESDDTEYYSTRSELDREELQHGDISEGNQAEKPALDNRNAPYSSPKQRAIIRV